MNPSENQKINNNNIIVLHQVTQNIYNNHSIENTDKINTACYQKDSIENGSKINIKTIKEDNFNHKCKKFISSYYIFILVTFLQFCNLFGLVLIQYISSNIQFSILVIIDVFLILLHIILIILTIKLSSSYSSKRHQSLSIKKVIQNQCPVTTVPKINFLIRKQQSQKTKKLGNNPLQLLPDQITQQRIITKTKSNQRRSTKMSIEGDETSLKFNILILLKAFQGIISLVGSVLSLTTINSFQTGKLKSAIILFSALSYLLICLSATSFILLTKRILRPRVSNQQEDLLGQKQKMQIITHKQAKSKISIDNFLPSKNEIVKGILVEREQGTPVNIKLTPRDLNKSQLSEKQVHIRNVNVKRSVLKSSKNHEPRRTLEEEEERKVQINSKNIQNSSDVQKFNPAPIIGLTKQLIRKKQKLDSEAQFLRKKKLSREKRARSSICLGRKQRKISNPCLINIF